MRSNVSTISSDSNTSINSLGKKRRAPAPPSKLMNQVSIPEETPSMVIQENHFNNEAALMTRRVLPDIPVPECDLNEPDIVPKPKVHPDKPKIVSKKPEITHQPQPAPRSSILEEAKIDVELASKHHSKKKSAKKQSKKASEKNQVPSSLELEEEAKTSLEADQRPLSPDSALASSESSGSSLRKQGKILKGDYSNSIPHEKSGLVRITPYASSSYEQFKPVVRKSDKIKEKIALFSCSNGQERGHYSTSTIGKVFPIPRKPTESNGNQVISRRQNCTIKVVQFFII